MNAIQFIVAATEVAALLAAGFVLGHGIGIRRGLRLAAGIPRQAGGREGVGGPRPPAHGGDVLRDAGRAWAYRSLHSAGVRPELALELAGRHHPERVGEVLQSLMRLKNKPAEPGRWVVESLEGLERADSAGRAGGGV